MKVAARIEGLNVKLGGASVIEGVDVSFRYGEIHALLGPNGAGKTTIFKAILGAVRYTGRIDTEPEALRIGHLIEYPAFYSRLSLIENLRLHADYLRVSHDELDGLLELVGLAESRNLAFGRTSLGMRQRLGIARTLVGNPGLLLLDEPTNGLDPMGIRDCRELLQRVRDERGVAVVVSSHNLTEVAALADHLTFLRAGEVVRSIARSRSSEQDLEELYVRLMEGKNS